MERLRDKLRLEFPRAQTNKVRVIARIKERRQAINSQLPEASCVSERAGPIFIKNRVLHKLQEIGPVIQV